MHLPKDGTSARDSRGKPSENNRNHYGTPPIHEMILLASIEGIFE